MNTKLGHLSPLAVSDIVYITSYYYGTESNYVMIKENGTITTNYLGKRDTEEPNGLMVKVPNNGYTNSEIEKEIKSLVFFPNIYVSYNEYVNDNINVNKAKVVRYKHFSVSNILRGESSWNATKRTWVLLGNVLYPLDINKLDSNLFTSDDKRYLEECNICLNINIGEINVTPNRESIIYSENTIKVLNNKLEQALLEIKHLIDTKTSENTDNIKDYFTLISKDNYWHPITGDIDTDRYEGWKCQTNATYKGIKRSKDYNDALNNLGRQTVLGFKTIYNGETFNTEKGLHWGQRDSIKVLARAFVAIEDNRNISGYTRKFVQDNPDIFKNRAIINKYDKDTFIDKLMAVSGYNGLYISKNPVAKEVSKELYEWVNTHTYTVKIAEINDYKKQFQDNSPRKSRVDNTLYSLHSFHYNTASNNIVSDSNVYAGIKFPIVIKELKTMKKVILHNGRELHHEQRIPYAILSLLGYRIIWCSNALYCKIIKYYAQRKHPHLFFNYDEVLNNLSAKEEKLIVWSRFITSSYIDDYSSTSFYHISLKYILKYIKVPTDLEIEYSDSIRYKSETLKALFYTKYFNTYTLRTQQAVILENTLEKYKVLCKKYHEIALMFEKYSRYEDLLSPFMFCKWCINHNYKVNIQEYGKLKRSKLIKFIYEQIN